MSVIVAPPEPPSSPAGEPEEREATGLLAWLTTTDHKRIGISYMVTAFAFFLIAGALAMLIRAELAAPELELVDAGTYNQLFTMHGSIMMFLFIGPFAFGLANYLVPLHIGAPDMSFPRLNALSYWLFLGGGLTMVSGFLTSDGAADFGWFAYAPLSGDAFSPQVGADLWLIGLVLTGFSGIFTAVNIVTTVFTLRAPGMTLFRMPLFTWNMLVTSVLVLMAFPVLTAASVLLFADRQFGAHIFDPAMGGSPILWQHLFWFFGHPEVYIVVLPYFGVFTEIFAVFSRRPVFGYRGLVFATLAIAALSMGVWAHHMFVTGAVLLPFFSGLSFLIAVPTGVKFFNWIGTMWGGRITFSTPMLFGIGFLLTFVFGGISGVILAAPPLDFQLSDSYYLVAHMHYVLFGGSVFGVFAAIYLWFPKFTGKLLHEGLGKLHFATVFVGVHLTFGVQHYLGVQGMPRRVAGYLETDGFTALNVVSTAGAFLTGISTLFLLWNVFISVRRGRPAGDNPFDGHTLEWATSSPPPSHNFDRPLPPIRSERPVFDQNHPDAPSGPSAPDGDSSDRAVRR
ncbi:MAG TPA: cytochrome c oxidase subunit I [Acidimicrobiales bacterium]|nr:cytochrome c oxidase subunit I [Acidimicrobiales bacterium]